MKPLAPTEIPGRTHPTDVHVASTPSWESDQAQVTAAIGGQSKAQDAIVRRLSRRVRRLAMMLSPTPADAEDAAQRALIEILQSLESYRADAALETWADRIAVRVALRGTRRIQRRQGLFERWLAPGAMPFGRSVPREAHDSTGLPELLMHLSPERREALVLHHVLEYSIEEVAGIAGVPVGTAKDRLFVARRQLRTWLSKNPSALPLSSTNPTGRTSDD